MDEPWLTQTLAQLADRVRQGECFRLFVSPSASMVRRGEEEPRMVRDDLPQRIAAMARQRVTLLIQGGPGSGKTTLWTVLTEAAADHDPPLVPVPIDVRTLLDAQTREEVIRRALPGCFSDAQIAELDDQRRLLLLIDGLSEIEHATRISDRAKTLVAQMTAGAEPCPVVATCRAPVPYRYVAEGPLARETVELVLLPFEPGQRDAVVARHGLDAGQFGRYLGTGHLETMASNPQLLSLLIAIFQSAPEAPAPQCVAEVFRTYFDVKWRERAPLVDQPDVGKHSFERCLGTLAWHAKVRGDWAVEAQRWSELLGPFDQVLARDGLSRQAVIDRSHALYVMVRSDERLQFVHDRFLDYFAARFLLALDEVPELAWHSPPWEETLALLAGLSDSGPARWLDAALGREQIALACKIAALNLGRLAEAELRRLFEAVARALGGRRAPRDQAARGLAEFEAQMATGHVREILPDVPRDRRPDILRALTLLRKSQLTPEALQSLRQREGRKNAPQKSPRRRGAHPGPLRQSDASQTAQDLAIFADPGRPSHERGAAATRLGKSGDLVALAALCAALKNDEDAYVRGSAATALGRIGDPSAVAPLCAALENDQPAYVRGSGATALGRIGDPSAVGPLCAALEKDQHPYARGSAATALGRIGDPSAVGPLGEALKDPASPVRRSAAGALGSIGDRSAVGALREALNDPAAAVRRSAARALGVIGDPSAVGPLCDALKDAQANVRGSAATALGVIGDRSAVGPLCDALKDAQANVRGPAATALGVIGDRLAVERLSEVLKHDGDPRNRGSAAAALGVIGDRLAIEPLCEVLKHDGDPRNRASSARALGVIGEHSAVGPLGEALKDGQANVRSSAARALGVIGDLSAVRPLRKALTDTAPAVRGSAAYALGLIAHPECVQELAKLAVDDDSFIRATVAKAMGRFTHPDALATLNRLRVDKVDKVRGAALHTMLTHGAVATFGGSFAQTLREDENGICRTIAAQGLGILGAAEHVDLLVNGLHDPDAGARGEAARSLAKVLIRLDRDRQVDIARRLVDYWRKCKHRETFFALDAAVRGLPPELAARLMREAEEGSPALSEWKQERWCELQRAVRLAARCLREEEALARGERELIARLWDPQAPSAGERIAQDLQRFAQSEEASLWQKLAVFGRGPAAGRNKKEWAMQQLVETFWKGLARGGVHQEVRGGSGRVDLWLYYGALPVVFELKILESLRDDLEGGERQLREYLRQNYVRYGALVLFAEQEARYREVLDQAGGAVTRRIGEEQEVVLAVVRAWKLPAPSSR